MKLIRFLVPCRSGHSKIKIMTVDGVCRKYEAPMYVKEALVDFPNHAIFYSDAVRKLGSRARPLPGTMAMEPGQLYFLVPVPQRTSRRMSTQDPSEKIVDTPTMEKQGSRGSRRVSFANTPSYIEPISTSVEASETAPSEQREPPRRPSLEVIPTSQAGVVRLKVVVSKQQLESIINEGGDTLSLVENLVHPLLKEAQMDSGVSREDSLGWKPTLDSIPEASKHST